MFYLVPENRVIHYTLILIVSILVVFIDHSVTAENMSACPQLEKSPRQGETQYTDDKIINIEADNVSGKENEYLLFEGDVELNSQTRTIKADRLGLTLNPRKIKIEGNVEVSNQDMVIKATEANIKNEGKDSTFREVEYRFRNRHAYGKASSIQSKENTAELNDASYTTCPGNNPAWELTSKKITLNQESGFGVAKNAKFTFKGVPILYTPVISFPIDDRRKSGFLFPRAGQSNQSGLELSLPYYWNIAPQYDATIVPHTLSRRGLMLENEFRYMGESFRGSMNANYLPKDQVTSTNRFFYSIDHRSKSVLDHWDVHLFGSATSDEDYLENFGNSLRFVSTSFLTRQAEATYKDKYNNLTALLRAYQIVDPNINNSNRPYHLLPRIELNTRVPVDMNQLKLDISSEYSRFTHPQKTEGDRLSVIPRLSWNYTDSGFYVKPALSWYLTQYQTDEGNITRSLPLLSVDSAAFFDKTLNNNSLISLEPRIFYLFVPEKNQDDIPLFDTSEPSFSVATLFRENRFSGKDRLGDANQFSLALTARFIQNQKKYETLTASIGQIFYIDDPQVTLEGINTIDGNRSGFVSEITYRPDQNWFFRSSFSMDPNWRNAENINANLGYRDNQGNIVNLEHVFHIDDVEQTGLSVAWPITDRWRGLGRWLFSHKDQQTLEVLIGLEYESCCWKLRLVNQRHVTDTGSDYNDSFNIQMVFKGVASIGEGSEILENEISGYSSYDE